MLKKIIGAMTLGMLLTANANASSWTLTGPDENVGAGEQFTVLLTADHGAEGLFAGGAFLSFDTSLISFDSLTFSPDLVPPFGLAFAVVCGDGSNPACTDGDPSDGLADIVAGGSVLSSGALLPLIPANNGPTLIATLVFTAMATPSEGSALIDLFYGIDGAGNGCDPDVDAGCTASSSGGWFDANFDDVARPDLFGASVNIDSAVIPLPAAIWFMIGGLGTLLGYRRKK